MKTAYIFPGQGSQIVGMGKDFYEQYAAARSVFDVADHALGIQLRKLCHEGPQDELNLTANTQPALLTASTAIAAVLRERLQEQVAFAAGHSLGEYSALCFAGCFTLETALRLVRTRGEAMQSATPVGVGAMAALIGLEEAAAAEICAEAAQGQVVQAANFNGPGQIVISGNKEAVSRAIEIAKSKGVKKAIPLPVSAPFHCALMQPAADRMSAALASSKVSPPQIAIVNNADAAVLDASAEAVCDSLIRQITSPVKWRQSIQYMVSEGVTQFVEIGAGRVLTNLVKRISPECDCFAISDVAGLESYIQGRSSGSKEP
jgi:[acyl-carrier-protein] S-malonyltransferase